MRSLILVSLILLLVLTCSKDIIRNRKSMKKPTPQTLQAYATKNGVVDFTHSSSTFQVSVDFVYEYTDASDIEDFPNTMLLGLYTDQTMLNTGSTEDFNNYYCDQYSTCSQGSVYTTITYPYFTATGNLADTSLYVDYNNWYLDYSSVLLANQYSGDGSDMYGDSSYGILGMAMPASPNGDGGTFSIYLSDDGESGKLLFNQDMSYAESDSTSITLSADYNLGVDQVTGILLGGSYFTQTNTSLIFDINAQYIGFPLATYNQVLTALNTYYNTNCDTDSLSYAYCYYSGTVNSLPTLGIWVQSQYIYIYPSTYVAGVSDGDAEVSSISLNFAALSSSLSGLNYVTPAYDNYIILDYHVMTYYYTVFNLGSFGDGNNSIYMYVADHTDHTTLYVILGCVAAALLLIACVCCCCRVKKVKKTTAIASNPTAQTPLIVNPQGSGFDAQPAASYQYTQNNYDQYNQQYNQPQYTQYPQQQYPNYPVAGANNYQNPAVMTENVPYYVQQ